MQGIQRHPGPGIVDGRFKLTLRAVAVGQAFQRPRQVLAQSLCLEELPFIKSGAAGHREAGQEVIAVEGGCFSQRCEASRAHLVRRMAVRVAGGQQVLELAYIQPDLGAGVEPSRLPIDAQPAFSQCPLERRQGTAQATQCLALVVFGPEQGRQCVAAVRFP